MRAHGRFVVRAILVSINLFSLLCDGFGNRSPHPYSNINQFGGPILYMVLQTIFAFSVLVYVDSGSPIPSFLLGRRKSKAAFTVEAATMVDVVEEKERLERGTQDVLQVTRLKKGYRGAPTIAVDDVSFGVSEGDTFALIGPNGAGKTTTLACIRGVVSDASVGKTSSDTTGTAGIADCGRRTCFGTFDH